MADAPKNLSEILEVADSVSSFAPMLRIYMDMLCLEEGCSLKDLKLAVVHRKPDGTGRVGPSWDGQAFLDDLTKLRGLLNVAEGSLLTPWDEVRKQAEVSSGRALDTIFEEIDDAGMAGKFEEIDAYIETIPVSEYPHDTALWLGVLSITRSMAKSLKKRAAFYAAVEQEALRRGRDVKSLLGGLKDGS